MVLNIHDIVDLDGLAIWPCRTCGAEPVMESHPYGASLGCGCGHSIAYTGSSALLATLVQRTVEDWNATYGTAPQA
jgi:hypothetical protein